MILRLLRAHRESRDVVATVSVDSLADGVSEEERGAFLTEIREAISALQEAEAALA